MTSFEIVKRTIEFECPPRLARNGGSLDETDIVTVGYSEATDFKSKKEGEDEWGVVWKSLHFELGDQGQVIENPLKEWDNFARYKIPDPYAPGRFDALKENLEKNKEIWKDKFIIGSLGAGPMHLLSYIRGFENFLIDILTHRENIEKLLDKIFYFMEEVTKKFAEYKVHGVILWDDQAMQTGPFFSMELWRKILMPRFAKLYDLAHSLGLKFFMHSCGNLGEFLIDLAKCGADVIDNKQPDLWKDSESVDKVRGKVCFQTCLDIQKCLPKISKSEVEIGVKNLIDRLSTNKGGFIATMYAGKDLDLPSENVEQMWRCFKEYQVTSMRVSR